LGYKEINFTHVQLIVDKGAYGLVGLGQVSNTKTLTPKRLDSDKQLRKGPRKVRCSLFAVIVLSFFLARRSKKYRADHLVFLFI
jgi:hypothetical protein